MSSVINSTSEDFLYFAFASNLLTERIHLGSPSAKKVAVGKVKNYRLDFNNHSEIWKGATATIVEEEGNYVYGVLWSISIDELENLDKQENVYNGMYHPIEVMVETENGEIVKARAYKLTKTDNTDKRPSYVYLGVIIRGAKENRLPEAYVKKLEKINHNGYKGEVGVKLSKPIEEPGCDQLGSKLC